MNDPALLLCTDMDGTVIPDGRHPEAPGARDRFSAFCAQPHVTLAYVTGRDRGLVEKAIAEYGLPTPDYAITDVGSMIYAVEAGAWRSKGEWSDEISGDWEGVEGPDIARRFVRMPELRLQEASKQNVHKVSFYVKAGEAIDRLREAVESQLAGLLEIRCNCIWSVDPVSGTGLLDILPRSANKRHAIRFLRQALSFRDDQVLFAGDSGNDMPVFESAVRSILVGNATDEVRQAACEAVARCGLDDTLYCARTAYAAGVLEGLRHFRPDETLEGMNE